MYEKIRKGTVQDCEISITAQGICLIHDPEIINELCVLLIWNNRVPDDKKPQGGGLPGGGRNDGKFDFSRWAQGGISQDALSKVAAEEDEHNAMRREFEDETGLPAVRIQKLGEGDESEEWKLIIQDSYGNALPGMIQRILKGRIPQFMLRRKEKAVLNKIFLFWVETEWENSVLRRFLIDHNTTSFLFNQYDEEEIAKLGIKERGEIGGIGIFPVEDVLNDYEREWERRVIYPSHRERLRFGVKEIRKLLSKHPNLDGEKKLLLDALVDLHAREELMRSEL